MNSKIRYVDAQKMHRQHPQNFDAPSGEMLSALKPGDWVKVCAYSERFWVEVKEINGEEVKGRIDNMLITRKLAYNQVISFAKKHIYDILTQEKHAKTKQHQATKRKGRRL